MTAILPNPAAGDRLSRSWFFEKYFQNPVRELFLVKPRALRDPDSFFLGFVMIQDRDGESCFFKIDSYLFFRYAGKADADINLPPGICHAYRRVKCFSFPGVVLVHCVSPSGDDTTSFPEISLGPVPGRPVSMMTAGPGFFGSIPV